MVCSIRNESLIQTLTNTASKKRDYEYTLEISHDTALRSVNIKIFKSIARGNLLFNLFKQELSTR